MSVRMSMQTAGIAEAAAEALKWRERAEELETTLQYIVETWNDKPLRDFAIAMEFAKRIIGDSR